MKSGITQQNTKNRKKYWQRTNLPNISIESLQFKEGEEKEKPNRKMGKGYKESVDT